MFGLPEAAVGGIVAALIAGLVSLLGLIISKEQKTSEFRQAWIDALRADLSAYLTQINAIHDAVKVKYESHGEKVSALSPLYILLNTSTFNIQLRINPQEKKSQRLLAAMNEFSALTSDEKRLTTENIRPAEIEFLSASQELLKSEWRRVKSGEWTFRIAKVAALLVVLASLLAVLTISADRLMQSEPAPEPVKAKSPTAVSPPPATPPLKPNTGKTDG